MKVCPTIREPILSKRDKKHPTQIFNPASGTKKPRGASFIPNIPEMSFQWRVDEIDFDGPYCWSEVDIKLFVDLVNKLHHFETMKWSEIEGGKNHFVDTDGVCKDAQDRLSEINKAHIDRLFSLRITGAKRIWGYRDVATLKVLWWDPEHSVCPSLLKHT